MQRIVTLVILFVLIFGCGAPEEETKQSEQSETPPEQLSLYEQGLGNVLYEKDFRYNEQFGDGVADISITVKERGFVFQIKAITTIFVCEINQQVIQKGVSIDLSSNNLSGPLEYDTENYVPNNYDGCDNVLPGVNAYGEVFMEDRMGMNARNTFRFIFNDFDENADWVISPPDDSPSDSNLPPDDSPSNDQPDDSITPPDDSPSDDQPVNVDNVEIVSDNASGLVGYYPFNNNAYDESQNNNHGTIDGVILTQDRLNNDNSAYYFDGVDDYIEILDDDSLDLTSDFTISFWCYVEEVKSYGIILNKHIDKETDAGTWWIGLQGNALYFHATPQFHGGLSNPHIEVDVGKWIHIVFTYHKSTNTWSFYKDGTLMDSGTIEFEIQNTPYNLLIGGHYNESATGLKPDNQFKGKLDEIRIYNRLPYSSEFEYWKIHPQ